MCMPTIPRLQVEREPVPLEDPRFGLLSAATVNEDMDPHGYHGVQYSAVCDPDVKPYPLTQCPPEQDNPGKEGDRSEQIVVADAFALYAAETCIPLGQNAPQARQRLRDRLLMGERHAVEAVVYNGLAGARPFLRDPEGAVLNDGAQAALPQAVGLLEQRLAALGRPGIIHAPRWMAPVMDHLGIVHRSGPRATTLLGTPIAFGSGYSGQQPIGRADGADVAWLYATPQITVWRSPIIEPGTLTDGAFDPATNSMFLLAERVYVVSWPCQVLAVATDLPLLADVAPITPPPGPGLTVVPSTGQAPLQVQFAVDNYGRGDVLVDPGDGTAPYTLTDPGTQAHTYTEPGTYVVTATSATGGHATVATAVVSAPVPDAPTGVTFTGVDATTATVSWDYTPGTEAPTGFEVSYRVAPGNGAWSTPLTVPVEDRSTQVDGLTATTEYQVRVRAVGAHGSSPYVYATGTTPAPVLEPVADLATTPTFTEIGLSWSWTSPEPGAPTPTGYVIAYGPTGSSGVSTLTLSDPSATSATLTDLTPDTSYDIEVRAVNAELESQPAQTSVSTPALPALVVTPTPATGAAPLAVAITVDAQGLGAVDLDPGDGSPAVTNPGDGTTPTSHTYAAAGSYTVTATTQLSPQATGTATVTVTA